MEDYTLYSLRSLLADLYYYYPPSEFINSLGDEQQISHLWYICDETEYCVREFGYKQWHHYGRSVRIIVVGDDPTAVR